MRGEPAPVKEQQAGLQGVSGKLLQEICGECAPRNPLALSGVSGIGDGTPTEAQGRIWD